MPTVTKGGATSGNSSVWSLPNEMSPKTTSASIDTTVTIGRLIAKSEMNMTSSLQMVGTLSIPSEARNDGQLFAGGESDGVLTRTGVPGEMPRAAPTNNVSPFDTPLLISTRSDSS